MLDLALDTRHRADWLRRATGHARDALDDRQRLDGTEDGADTAKSAALLAKILLARCALVGGATGHAAALGDIQLEAPAFLSPIPTKGT